MTHVGLRMRGAFKGWRSARGVRVVAGPASGSALVELAVCLPLLALVLVGTADFARVFYTSISLTNAARAGAQYGAYSPAQSGDTAQIQATATASIAPVTFDAPQASRTCQCFSDAGAAGATISCTTGTCGSGQHRVMTVTVTATKSFTTISALLGVPCRLAVGGCSLTRTATLRVSE